jgi:TetR/AcrR family transcriptional repressor of nem operon
MLPTSAFIPGSPSPNFDHCKLNRLVTLMYPREGRFSISPERFHLGRLSKRADILRAGVELFHQRGYGIASVESIAEAAAVPKGSFFNHFRSKEEFAQEALEAYFAPWMGKSEAILRRNDLSSKQKLVAMLRIATAKTSGCYQGCMVGNLSLEMANQSEPLRMVLAKILENWTSAFERVIRDGQSSGAFHAALVPDKTARFIVNLFQGAALRSKVERSDRAIDEFEEFVLTILVAR